MCFAASNLSAEPLAKEVCDRLLKKGLLNANPAYVHKVREAELAEIFEEANLDGRTLPLIGGEQKAGSALAECDSRRGLRMA